MDGWMDKQILGQLNAQTYNIETHIFYLHECLPQSVLDAVVPQTHSDPHGHCLGAVIFDWQFLNRNIALSI